jgi:hypothetical protein
MNSLKTFGDHSFDSLWEKKCKHHVRNIDISQICWENHIDNQITGYIKWWDSPITWDPWRPNPWNFHYRIQLQLSQWCHALQPCISNKREKLQVIR